MIMGLYVLNDKMEGLQEPFSTSREKEPKLPPF